MNTPESGHVVKHLGHHHRFWRLRKPCSCLAHRRVPAAGRFQVEDAQRRMVVSDRCQEAMGAVDHAHRDGRCLVHSRLRHVHTILHPPIRRGIPAVQLDLQATAVIGDPWCLASMQVTPTPPHLGTCLRLQRGLDHADHLQGMRPLLVPHHGLLKVRLAGVFPGGPLQVRHRQGGRGQLTAGRARRSSASIRTVIRDIPRRIMAPLGNQGYAHAHPSQLKDRPT